MENEIQRQGRGNMENRTLVPIGFQPSSFDSIPVPPHLQQVSSIPESIQSRGAVELERKFWGSCIEHVERGELG